MTSPYPAFARPHPAAAATAPSRLARWLALAAFASCTGAQAAPDVLPDAVSRFLAERGLAGEATGEAGPSSGLFRQVRSRASDLVVSALDFLGVPYRHGGESEDEGFDCSGFTRRVFERTLGLVLPRRSDEQAAAAGLVSVPRDELAPGDLVFFNTLRHAFSHVGIYIGEGRFVHAPRSGSNVRIEDMRGSYWARRFDGARRVQAAADSQPS